ncbi:MAG: ABC transporter ATP-binding protein [Lentisphaeria bacterium]|nr:ABC transporter ATP-binding protein [Lentisphaeria bacterium]
MSRRTENEKEFKSVSYWRILRFVRPYWLMLAIGILAGMTVGGSLFGGLMLIPDIAMIVDQDTGQSDKQQKTAEDVIRAVEDAPPGMTEEEKTRLVTEIMHPVDTDPKLTKALDRLQTCKEVLHLPIEVGKRSVMVQWPAKFEFPIVDDFGRMTWQFFMVYAVLFVLAWILKNVATFINHYNMRWVSVRVIADMRNLLYERVLSQSMKFFGHQDVGHLISRCTNDTAMIENSISDVIADITRCPLEIIACLSALIILSLQHHMFTMLIIIVVGMPICVIPVMVLARKIRRIYKGAFAQVAELVSRMHETFSGILLIKSNHTEKREVRKFVLVNGRYFRTVVNALRWKLFMAPIMEIITVTISLGFLVYAYSRGVSISQMFMLLAPAFLMYQPIKEITKIVNNLQRSMAAADRYFDLVDMDTALPEKKDAVELREFRDAIVFDHVSFAYEPGRNVIRDISFSIPRGKMVAVVGETGSGKTTIASLLSRLYDVTEGEVLIDGRPVTDYTITSLRRQIGIVTQEPIIFNDTIANNIAYSRPGASKEEIREAAERANAHNFIVSGTHPLGYEEEAGEKGCKLSGGEKQRIALARIILKNPPILVLDEATSALDTVTEKLIQDALNRVMENRTVFAIAHRLSTIRNADLILVMDKGEIVERGTHEELLAMNGRYRKLHDTQFSMDRDD